MATTEIHDTQPQPLAEQKIKVSRPGAKVFCSPQEHKLLQTINKESTVGYWKSPRGLTHCTRDFVPKEKKPKALIFYSHGIQGHIHSAFEDKKGLAIRDLLLGRMIKERGWGFFEMDAEGHGFSEGTFLYIPSHMDCVRDAIARAKSVIKKYPGVPWFLMGESWGGNICLTAGLLLQDMDASEREGWLGVLLIAPAVIADLPPALVVCCLRYCMAPCCPKTTPFFMPNPVNAKRIWRDDDIRHYMEIEDDLGGGGRAFRLGTATQLLWSVENIQRHIKEIKFPFAVAHGSEDQAIKPEGSHMLFKNSSTDEKNKKLKEFPGAYHDLVGDPVRLEVVNWLLDCAQNRIDKLDDATSDNKRESIGNMT
ncbi:hypothetical protein AAMO2058_000780500 [Amorphochlora amoebiformis]